MSANKETVIDDEIMEEILNKPEVKKETEGMTPSVLAWYKELLVSEGIYDRYVRERSKK